jgi:DNA adenine methylase
MAMSYIGGKSRVGKWIVPYYPDDIETYVECFSGMMWCFFNMNLEDYPNLNKVVYNDINPLNYNLFQCIQNPSELQRALDSISVQQVGVSNTPPEMKEQFVGFQADIFAPDVRVGAYDYEVAAKYVYVLTQVFSGSNPETSSFIDLKGKYRSKYLAFRDKLSKPNWVEHFLKITDVENMDFGDVISKYDGPKTYFYVDPPYYIVGEGKYYSNHNFNREDHQRLANDLNGISGRFSLSYYDFDELHNWFPENSYRWERKKFAKAASAKKNGKQSIGEELLIMNY